MNEDRPEMEVIPTSKDLVAQYLLLYSFSGDPDDFDEIVDYDYQHANVAVYMRTDHTRDVTRVVNIIRDFDFDEIVDYDYQHANVAVYMRDHTRDVTRVEDPRVWL